MKTRFLNLLIVALITVQAINAVAEIPEKANPPRLVNDFAGVFNRQEVEQLEQKLVQYANETSTQIVVVTVKDLDGYDISDYSFRLGEKWGVGQKGKNNGVVIVLKPKTGQESGRVFVAIGYGLESIIPDATANRQIVDYEMVPRFKEGDYFGGISNGINVIMRLAKGEFTADQYAQSKKKEQKKGSLFGLVIIIIIILLFISRGRRNRFYTPGSAIPWWLALTMLNSGRSSGSGSWGGFSGGGGFGSGGGGGFGGFGGGSFGGGGAGGSW
jgi:uncharacterized protein